MTKARHPPLYLGSISTGSGRDPYSPEVIVEAQIKIVPPARLDAPAWTRWCVRARSKSSNPKPNKNTNPPQAGRPNAGEKEKT